MNFTIQKKILTVVLKGTLLGTPTTSKNNLSISMSKFYIFIVKNGRFPLRLNFYLGKKNKELP